MAFVFALSAPFASHWGGAVPLTRKPQAIGLLLARRRLTLIFKPLLAALLLLNRSLDHVGVDHGAIRPRTCSSVKCSPTVSLGDN